MSEITAVPRTARIGFIGLGLMGLPMATNLVRAGYRLTGHTRTPARAESLLRAGASLVTSPAEVAQASDVVITMLPDTPDVLQVATAGDGILSGAKQGLTWIDMSTISPRVWRDLATKAADRRVGCLDAPVSGGDVGATQGTLLIMVGGSAKTLERCLPILECLGKTIVLMGPAGAGQVTKACNQIVLAATIAGVAEALVFGAKAGVDPAAIRRALLGGFAQSKVLDVHGQRMLAGAFKPGFYLRLHEKDLHIATEEGRAVGVSLPVTALVAQLMSGLIAEGHGQLDDSALVKVYEELAAFTLAETKQALSTD